MKKKLLSLALVLAMALSLLPTAALAATCDKHSTLTGLTEISTEVYQQAAKTTKADCTKGNVAETVTEDTLKTLYQCKTCYEFFTSEEIVGEDGSKTFKLTKVDANHTVEGVTPPKAHTWGDDSTCDVCGFECTNHAPSTPGDATQNDDGTHTFTCGTCGKKVENENCSYPSEGASKACTVCGRAEQKITVTKAEIGSDLKALTVNWTAAGFSDKETYTITLATGAGNPIEVTTTAKSGSHTGSLETALEGPTGTITVKSNTKNTVSGTKELSQKGTTPVDPTEKSIGTPAAEKTGATTAKVSFSVTGYDTETTFTVTLDITSPAGDAVEKTVKGTTGTLEVSFDNVQDGVYTVKVEDKAGKVSKTAENVTLEYHAPTTPTTPTTPTPKPDPVPSVPPTTEKLPTTNSQGIPVASEVSTPAQADAAVNTLKNTSAAVLQERLMTDAAAITSFQSLESAVRAAKSITVTVDVERSKAPSAVISSSAVRVTGAAFNAASSGSTVSLVVDAPSKAYSFSSGYQVSMTMTGVSNAAQLAVPVIITLPLPSDVSAAGVVVLHYHGGSSNPEAIYPAVSGRTISFPVTGFSDFVITDRYDSGVPVSGVPRSVRNNSNDLSDVLPAIAALLSGDGVFADVPGTHWASKEIRWARDGGLMSGYENGQFRPWASTTRQQLWMVLARLSGTRPSSMAEARQWAINTGVSDGSNPTGELSRQQLVTMLYRFAKTQGVNVSATSKLGGYTDNGKVASYAKEALSWANAKGIMGGDSKGKLNPEGTATRAHFAVFLYRYSKL